MLDPFAGGGSMPLEALRLGCDAVAMDLNPVAYLALIASLVYPQQYGRIEDRGLRIEDQEVGVEDGDRLPGMRDGGRGQAGLVEDVKYWAEWVMTQAEAEVGACYPVDADGAVPLVDVLHAACLLWTRDRQEDLAALIAARGGELWSVAQAVVELLGRDSPERTALMSLLGTRSDLETRAQRWAATHPRVEPKETLVQASLWGEDAA